jgi:hypothetical protein
MAQSDYYGPHATGLFGQQCAARAPLVGWWLFQHIAYLVLSRIHLLPTGPVNDYIGDAWKLAQLFL